MTISKDASVIPTDCTGAHLEHGFPATDWYLLHNDVVRCIENCSQHISVDTVNLFYNLKRVTTQLVIVLRYDEAI
jgi:hypothetical protein